MEKRTDSLTDYILWMGDFPISATGFREADALVLCALSYIDLSPVFGKAEPVFVRDCQRMLDEGTVRVEIAGKDMGYPELLRAAVQSRRFGDLLLTDYADILREDPPLQFSAVAFHDDKDWSFLAFRGTDDSLAGWREDFMISFSHTGAQELAAECAEKIISPGRRWMMGGHSKGGNLALYAGCMLSGEKLRSLERVFLLDSPGLCPEVVDPDRMKRLEGKVTRMIPEFSIVGKLFESGISDAKIVRSSSRGFAQHNLSTWEIDHGMPSLLTENDRVSLWINDVIDRWIRSISREERVVFIDEVFDALSAGGVKTLDELTAEGWDGYSLINSRFKQVSETTKRILSDLPKQAIINSLPSRSRSRQAEKADSSSPAEDL